MRASDLDRVQMRPPRFAAGRPRGSVRVIAEGESTPEAALARDERAALQRVP